MFDENELDLTILPGRCTPFISSWLIEGAESDRARDACILDTYVPVLKGGGLEPVGRVGRSFRRLARYEADSECECLCFHGGLRGGIVAQLRHHDLPFCVSVKFVGVGGDTFLFELKLALLLCNMLLRRIQNEAASADVKARDAL